MKSKNTILIALAVLLSLSPLLISSSTAEAGEGAEEKISEELSGPTDKVLSYLYTTAHWVGKQVKKGVNEILPSKAQIPESLVDPIGFLVLLTVFLAIAEVAKKITWFLVLAGWLLILVRIGIILAESYI